ncbi:MAG: 16S rRNA (guanine(966)-N(2))-methyltransferase RsmD [Ignavibacteriaceae bacterium]|nr:16S rRNA (guanine(966)-N(2))-methyltransferase RsmD [Ignavibacteriaceae bacterium]
MRIISGKFKGRLIRVPDSKLIRPTTDRVRETLFNLLNNKIDFDRIKVLDIYSGSGSLGLECMSRGADEIHFVEKNFQIYKNLQENINSLDAGAECRIFKMEALRFSQISDHGKYDLILADPPFSKDDIYRVVENLKINKFLNDQGIIIIERSIQTRVKDIPNFGTEPFKIIGDTCLYEI